jgi:uncharacterized protein YndB with AHSA1/START domain
VYSGSIRSPQDGVQQENDVAATSSSNEIRITRVYDAPVGAVWDAWIIPEQAARWWGPRGFTLTTHSKDLRAGGHWRYTMHGPDGVDHPNLATYHRVERHKTLIYDHGATDDSPPLFRVTATFSEAQGQTTMELVFTLDSPQAAAQIATHIKQAGGNATWDRLAEHLAEASTGRRCFVIHRTLDAPVERVFAMWAEPDHLAKWLPPPGSKMRFLRPEIAVGKSTHFVIAGDHGTVHVRAEYVAIDPLRRIVYRQQFVDEREQPAPAPGATTWPAVLLTTVQFTQETPDRTRVMLGCEPWGAATSAEIEAFVAERPGMTLGWTHSFDVLETILA